MKRTHYFILPLYKFFFGSHRVAMYDSEEDQKVERENPNLDNNIVSAVVQTARDAIRWALMQVVKVLRIIKAAVQALFQTVVPEKIGAQVGSAVRSARERLVTAIFRSALATWAVLSCFTINLLSHASRIIFSSWSAKRTCSDPLQ